MNLKVDVSKLQEIVEGLDKEIANLENAYKDIQTNMENIDGTHEIWKSTSQNTTYDYYKEVKQDFDNSVENIKNLKIFLSQTINNYKNSVTSNEKNIDDNGDNLDTN